MADAESSSSMAVDEQGSRSPEPRPGSSGSSASTGPAAPSSPTPRRRLTGPFYLQNILNSDDERERQAAAAAGPPSSLSPVSPPGPTEHDTFIYSHPPPPPPSHSHLLHIAPSPHAPAGVYIHPLYPRSRAEADADYLRRQLCLAPTVNVDLWAIADPPDGQKPFASLPTLIKLAIHGDPKQKLTLQGICESLVNRFAWFKEHQMDDAWKNSVRHNLSLNKVFRKVPRDAKQMGKGCYWELDLSGGEGHKRPRKRRKHDKATGTMVSAIQSTRASTTVQIPYGVSRDVMFGPGAVPGPMLHHGPIASGSGSGSMGRLVASPRPGVNLGRLVVPRLRPVKMEPEESDMEVESEDDDDDEEEEEDELDPEPEEEMRMEVDNPSASASAGANAIAEVRAEPEHEDDEDDDNDVESEEATDAYRPRLRAPPAPSGRRVMRPRPTAPPTSSRGPPTRRSTRSTRTSAPSTPRTTRAVRGRGTRGRGRGGSASASASPSASASTSTPTALETLTTEAMRLIEPYSSPSPSSFSPSSFSHPPPPPPPSAPPTEDSVDSDSSPHTMKREPSSD